MVKDPKTYRVIVPIELELEMQTAMQPADALAAIIEAFSGSGKDPLLGANVRFQVGRGLWIARTTGARLNGRTRLVE